ALPIYFFKLLFLKIQEPDEDIAAFSSWKEKEKTLNAARGGSDFFRGEIKKIWYPDNPSFSENVLDTLNRELLLRKYKIHFSDFKNYTFILTGDFNSETLLKKVKKYFAALPVSGKEDNLQPVSKEFSLIKRNDAIRLKNLDQAFAEIYYPVKVPTDIKTQAILDIINIALNERIFNRLRIGSYSPRGSGYWIDKKNSIYTFFINFDSELGNEHNMLEYAEEEFTKLRKTGVDQDWLDTKIKLQINRHQQQINSFGYFNFWPEYLKKTIKNKENPEDWILQYPSLLQNFISLEDVNEAVKKYLSKENLQQFLVIPEGYKE
ncbi:MAG: insulinase family protein, partial [Flavobacteriales bacterium]